MNLHELKIWMDGFQAALQKDAAPNKEQWVIMIEKIQTAVDASTNPKG